VHVELIAVVYIQCLDKIGVANILCLWWSRTHGGDVNTKCVIMPTNFYD